MPPAQRPGPSIVTALALGALQGPTELLPVSSSAHTTLIPWLAGRPGMRREPQLHKAFEVALHVGAGIALALDMRGELLEELRSLDRRGAATIALSLAPPVLAGYALERPIERRLGGPAPIIAGLLVGAVAMALADLRPGGLLGRGGDAPREALGERRREDAGPLDGLALGVAQALALSPGVSRNGATLTAARARGFSRRDAAALSWHAALPVILGAGTLKGARLLAAGRGADAELAPGTARALGAGAAGAFASTLAAARVLRRPRTSGLSLLPFALYRGALAAIALRKLRVQGSAQWER